MVDEGCDCFDGTTLACGPPEGNVGSCRMGTRTCVAGQWGGCVGSVGPTSEICNGADDDCDGTIDDGCACVVGATRACYSGPAATAGVGPCRAGTQTCAASAGVAGWSTCVGEVLPQPESCNGVDDDCNGAPDDAFSTPEQVVVPSAPNRKADILFVIDNSLSMEPHQDNLLTNFPVLMSTLRGFPGGLPDLHLAVITSDLGAGPETGYVGCMPGGAGGAFHVPGVGSACQGPTGSFIEASNNEAVRNYGGTIEEAFACIADVGTAGCGFEHPLASAAMALGLNGTVPSANAGFLRPDAFLAITFITNEDDCSAPPDTPVFTTTSRTLSDPYGPPGSFRCNELGHLCGGVPPPRVGTTPVTLTECRSAEEGPLIPVARIAEFFRSLKSDPSMLFVSAIAGPPNPYVVTYRMGASAPSELWPVIDRSCVRGTGAYADPAVRMAELVATFGENGSFSSICADSYAPALERLGTAIGRGLTPHCLAAAVPDRDPDRPGIQASCQTVGRVPADGGISETPIPQCDDASPSAGPQPCWYLAANATCPSGIQLALNRTGAPAPGETIAIRCNPCGPSGP